MNLNTITTAVKNGGGRALLKAQKHTPEILTAAGVIGGVVAAVMGAKATIKANDRVYELKADIKNVKAMFPEGDESRNRAIAQIYAVGGLDLAKIYGPSVSLGAASIVSIVSAHGIMHRRNVALAAAYTAVEQTFADYRARVAEQLGEDKELDIKRGVTVEKEVDEKTGKTKKVTVVNADGVSQYAVFFDSSNVNWEPNPHSNLTFLKAQQNMLNDMLLARGHVFLNEVYDRLGFPRTQAGQIVGWVLSEEGDHYVDFGIFDQFEKAVYRDDRANDTLDEERRDFVNGHRSSILLDFNVDGPIFDKI